MTDLAVQAPCFHAVMHPDGHVVTMKPKIGLVGATVAGQKVSAAYPDMALILGALVEVYVRYGVAEIDDKPASDSDIDALLADEDAGRLVAERGDQLYSESVTAPLRDAVSRFLAATQTDASTSAPTESSPKRRKRSKPSSTTTTPTEDTETTGDSPDGDSSS